MKPVVAMKPMRAKKPPAPHMQPRTTQRWQLQDTLDLFALPFADLLDEARTVHLKCFAGNQVQASALLNIKTGKCPENCSYCPQSAHYDTDLQSEPLMAIESVCQAAQRAKELGSTRFCMGAAWRSPNDTDLAVVAEMVKRVRALGMETCTTLGMLTEEQARTLQEAGLDYYNHNIDTSESHYDSIISSRSFADRMDTIAKVQQQGIKVCAGGIIGMGESRQDRAMMLCTLANLTLPPDSVPINKLVPIPGTPLADAQEVDVFEFVRVIAVARILMPQAYVRLSAGRESMSDELQFLCFFAGANSVFYGEQLLTTPNASPTADSDLFARLGMSIER